ncbi:hypothetical protein [Paucisalibacillus globulus]|jgi:hypothetical protein|uniref:hypothetical protein n=1 Tax=Paucisalibacillus globulus TaxID=351095 RepID=UPI0004202A84|nr:hypothetical protein [Paucisalibacillus globulus]
MKKVINKKVYDTEESTLIAEYSNGLSNSDFSHVYEDLYVTKKGQFFLHAQGGPLTIYSESNNNSTWGIETIILMDSLQVITWLELRNKTNEIEHYFPELIEKG